MNIMPQAFADAVCNNRAKTLRYFGLVEDGEAHTMHRYRGVEGKNGVACDNCAKRALDIWADYLRIMESIK